MKNLGWLALSVAFLMVLAFACSGCSDNGQVSGVVLESYSKIPLSNVTARIKGTQAKIMTGIKGEYLLANVVPGNQVISFEREGYSVLELPIVVGKRQTIVAENVYLLPELTRERAAALISEKLPGEEKCWGHFAGDERLSACLQKVGCVKAWPGVNWCVTSFMSKCHFRITRRANGGYGEIGRCLDGETMIGKPELKSITGIEKTSDALADVEYEFDFVPDGSNPATACFPGCTGYIYDKVTAFSYIIKKKVRMKRYDDGWRIAD